jgi:death-on-curing protein
MITVKQSLEIHKILIEKYGGSTGVRDLDGLESALARPFQTFGGEDLYPDFFAKAAAIAESIIINHPFIDGNKRTGYVLMESILRYGSIKIIADDESLYNFMISISTGEKRFDDIVAWLKKNTQVM